MKLLMNWMHHNIRVLLTNEKWERLLDRESKRRFKDACKDLDTAVNTMHRLKRDVHHR